jgi:hypothetical protein
MGPANFNCRKLRQGGKRLSTSFVGPSTESRFASAPNVRIMEMYYILDNKKHKGNLKLCSIKFHDTLSTEVKYADLLFVCDGRLSNGISGSLLHLSD